MDDLDRSVVDSNLSYSTKIGKKSGASITLHVFLDAFSHLYKRVCPSVGWSVRHTRVEIMK